jgi:molybdenum cofactor guanylyltransferase
MRAPTSNRVQTNYRDSMDVRRYRQIAGFILAGGTSSRMGRDKALLNFGGVPLILHTARLLDPLVTKVTVVGLPRRYSALGLRAIPDEDDAQGRGEPGNTGRGPLAGIAAALAATNAPWNLIVACDLPYLSPKWLNWLLSRAQHSRMEAIVPRTEHGIEPLAALYRRECSAPIAAALARGVRKVSDAIKEMRLDIVYARDWRPIEPSEMILRNMNAPRDFEEAQHWWSARHLQSNEHLRTPLRGPRRKRRSAPRRRK